MKASETSVLSFIGGLDKTFTIPPYQRNYEWTIEQCNELFNDIENAYLKEKTHYLGNVVYYFGEKNGAEYTEVVLVDGQQRITTIILLLCAIRDSGKSKDEFQKKIDTRYLINDTSDEKYRIRLKQTAYDYQNFLSVINKSKNKDENNNIVKNYNHFLELLHDTDISLNDLYNTIQKLEIVSVNLEIENDLESVQTIFEKINSTGKPLSAADLIRNCLLLSKSSAEQQRLYDNYWINIERTIENDSISFLAKNYLIIQTFSDIANSEIYKVFKEYSSNSSKSHEEILGELVTYSKFFNWLKKNNSPKKELNKYIQELNYLKTEDVYPLYLYLLNKLYDKDINELLKIFHLLSDFMLRFRIVSASGGGGALRSVVYKLLEKMSENEIQICYEDIYSELSNSPTKSGRYPSDDDFKQALMQSRKNNHTYGRVLLRKIEDYETKNISVPLEEITVEHFMPQTLNEWWNKNFGGAEKAVAIYEKYLNCIGNLGIMSQGYNSSNYNKSWNKKLEIIKQVQFNITKEVVEYKEWDETHIQVRNVDLANRACKAITPPQTRKKMQPLFTVEFENGIYPASDITTDMNGSDVKEVLYKGKPLGINSWRYYFNEICKITYKLDSEKFGKIVKENLIHKNSKKRNGNKKDPLISKNSHLLVEAKKIGNSEYYSEGSLSSERARIYAKQLLDLYGITDCFSIYVVSKDN